MAVANGNKNTLADRMRGYRGVTDHVLTGRMPILAHVDGIGFSKYTRKAKKPFDEALGNVMLEVAQGIIERVQGAVFAYTQSDEINLLIHGYKTLGSQPHRGNRLQKLVADLSGPTSSHFTHLSHKIWLPGQLGGIREAAFAAAVFPVPENDVTNYFLHRQQDALRNSVQMLARSMYSHKQIEHKSVAEMKEMCRAKGNPWEKLDYHWQRGACVYRSDDGDVVRDLFVPLFNHDRDYIERHLALEDG